MDKLTDVATREDVELLVNSFYGKVKIDNTLGYIFNNIIGDDWSRHLPIMYSFWEMILLDVHNYKGQPIGKHIEVDQQIPLKDEHYQRWLELWTTTVDSMFAGKKAEEAKKRAQLMMGLIKMKVNDARLRGFIQ